MTDVVLIMLNSLYLPPSFRPSLPLSLLRTLSLCLSLGPTGVGLNELKRKLLISDPQHFSVTVPRKSTHL